MKKFTSIEEAEIRSTVRFYIRQCRPFMARRQGRIDYLYESFMLAAKKRYTTGSPQNPLSGVEENHRMALESTVWHQLLCDTLYATRPAECAWHARMSEDAGRLHSLYTDLDFLNRYYQSRGAHHLKAEMCFVPEGIIQSEIKTFISETAAVLETTPGLASAFMYKELPEEYKPEAARLAKAPWARLDRIPLPQKSDTHGSLSPKSIVSQRIERGCIAANSREAFLLSEGNTVHIIDFETMEDKSVFTLEAGKYIKKLLCDPFGKFIAAAFDGELHIYKLLRDKQGRFISMKEEYRSNYLQSRFGGVCAFPSKDGIVFQTPEHQVVKLILDDGGYGRSFTGGTDSAYRAESHIPKQPFGGGRFYKGTVGGSEKRALPVDRCRSISFRALCGNIRPLL